MTKFRLHICEALADLIFFIVFFVAAVMLMFYLNRSTSYIIYIGAMFIPYGFLFFIRMRKRNFFLFAFCHLILLLIPIYLVGDIAAKIVFFAMIIVFIIYSYFVYFNDSARDLNYITLFLISIVFSAFYIASGIIAFRLGQNIALIGAVCAILLFYLFLHITNVDDKLFIITQSSVQPVEKILKSSNRIIFVFILITGVILILSNYFFVDKLLTFLSDMIMFILRSMFSGVAEEQPTATPEIIKPTPASGSQFPFNMEDNGPSLFWRILEILFQIITFPALIILIIAVIYKTIKIFYKRFNTQKGRGQDEKEFILSEVFEFNAFAKSIRDTLAPSNRIRRIFYKKVRSYAAAKKIKIKYSDTASELATKVKTYEDINDILEKYESVRYGKGREK